LNLPLKEIQYIRENTTCWSKSNVHRWSIWLPINNNIIINSINISNCAMSINIPTSIENDYQLSLHLLQFLICHKFPVHSTSDQYSKDSLSFTSGADPINHFFFVFRFLLFSWCFVTYRKKSLIINWASLAAKTEKFFISKEKKFYRIGYRFRGLKKFSFHLFSHQKYTWSQVQAVDYNRLGTVVTSFRFSILEARFKPTTFNYRCTISYSNSVKMISAGPCKSAVITMNIYLKMDLDAFFPACVISS